MSSLIKLNHKKFLSKSSWNIRGGNTRQCNPPINTAIRRKGSDRFIHKMLDKQESDHRLVNDNENFSITSDISMVSGQKSNDTNSNLNRSNDSKGLRRMKGMSYSVTDLRELTDKKDFDWLEVSDGFQQEIKDRRHEMYIAEIEMDSFHQLGPTIRAIYDGDEHEKFMEKLDARIKNHDKDIERMCNCHYQGFVDCIHELLQVRPQAKHLNDEIIAVNNELQKSSENVLRKADELIKYRRVVCNTSQAIEHLQQCLPVLEMYAKLESQMEEKRYYPALKTLEQLEHTFLPRVSKYRFAQSMCTKIPEIREQIKTASMTDLKDFLEKIRQLSVKIGEIAMRTVAHQQNVDVSILPNSSSTTGTAHSTSTTNGVQNNFDENSNNNKKHNQKHKKRRAPKPPNPFGDDSELEETESANTESDVNSGVEEELSATDLVDFSPVYRCLHIFGCLGAREQFETYYRQQRLQQAKLALQSPIHMNEAITSYHNYFCGVVGFFVIEDHIMNTSTGLVTKPYLAEVWENALQTIIASIRTHSSYCSDADLMLKIKRLIMLFNYTLESYGYNVSLLLNLLVEMRNQYNDILMKQWVQVFKAIFDADNYHPIQVNNQTEYNQIINEFPFYESEVVSIQSNGEFPKKFPFSSFVPKIYREVKQFILSCLKFSEDLNLSQTEIEDTVRKATNLLLTRTLSECLSSLIKNPNLGLLQLIQITINTNYLEDSSIYLEDFISKTINQSSLVSVTSPNGLTPTTIDSIHLARLQGRSMFKDIRADAESQIYIRLNQKIDEFLELENYDWMLLESPGMASPYISDLIAFLRSTFEAFTNLPLKVAQTACLSACKHIASSLLNLLLEEKSKCMSWGALQQFNLDLIQCELFASSEPVREFEEGSLQMCFAELRQLMDLFTEMDSWSNYFADYGKQDSKYLRVNPNTALTLLEKLREGEKKKTIFASLTKNERDKKNKTDTVVKKLKQLISNNTVDN